MKAFFLPVCFSITFFITKFGAGRYTEIIILIKKSIILIFRLACRFSLNISRLPLKIKKKFSVQKFSREKSNSANICTRVWMDVKNLTLYRID